MISLMNLSNQSGQMFPAASFSQPNVDMLNNQSSVQQQQQHHHYAVMQMPNANPHIAQHFQLIQRPLLMSNRAPNQPNNFMRNLIPLQQQSNESKPNELLANILNASSQSNQIQLIQQQQQRINQQMRNMLALAQPQSPANGQSFILQSGSAPPPPPGLIFLQQPPPSTSSQLPIKSPPVSSTTNNDLAEQQTSMPKPLMAMSFEPQVNQINYFDESKRKFNDMEYSEVDSLNNGEPNYDNSDIRNQNYKYLNNGGYNDKNKRFSNSYGSNGRPNEYNRRSFKPNYDNANYNSNNNGYGNKRYSSGGYHTSYNAQTNGKFEPFSNEAFKKEKSYHPQTDESFNESGGGDQAVLNEPLKADATEINSSDNLNSQSQVNETALQSQTITDWVVIFIIREVKKFVVFARFRFVFIYLFLLSNFYCYFYKFCEKKKNYLKNKVLFFDIDNRSCLFAEYKSNSKNFIF